MLKFKFLDNNLEDKKRSAPNDGKHLLNPICS